MAMLDNPTWNPKGLTMTRNRSLARMALVASVLSCTSARAAAPASLDEMLTPHLARHGLPALAAAVVKDGEIVAAGAVGTRRAGEQIAVTRDDRFHLGSDTKAFTSLLAAMFVEEGKLRWDSTLAEVFPKLEAKMDPGLRKVTLAQFLSHTSGIPGDNEAFKDLLDESMPGTATSTSYAPGSSGAGACCRSSRIRERSSPMRT